MLEMIYWELIASVSKYCQCASDLEKPILRKYVSRGSVGNVVASFTL